PSRDGATRAAGTDCRAGHADHQRTQDLRPRIHPRAGLLTRRGNRGRGRDVQGLLRRRPGQRARQRPRRPALPTGGTGDDLQHPAVAEGSDVSITSIERIPELQPAGTAVTGPPRRSLASRIATRLGGAAAYTVVLLLAAFWLLPTLGLFVESMRDPADSAATGWWTVFSR